MVFLSNATSNLRKGGLTTRGGGNTEELINNGTPPTATNQKSSWWSKAMGWAGDHAEGLGKTVGGIGAAGAWLGDTIIAAKGGKPFLQKGLKDLKKEAGALTGNDEQSGLGKFVKGFSIHSPEKEDKEVRKESNGHVPVGYDNRIKPYYINPSVNRRPHMFSEQVAGEWRRHKQHVGELTGANSVDTNRRKLWKKWKKWKKWHKKHDNGKSKGKGKGSQK